MIKPDEQSLSNATLEWSKEGPIATKFNDIYHAKRGAQAQAEAVFIEGSHFTDRWLGQDSFTVLELGFGFGVNFFATLTAYKECPIPHRPKCLHFISIEAYPVSYADLCRFYAETMIDSGLAEEQNILLQHWPLGLPGVYKIEFFGGQIVLHLWLSDVQNALSNIQARVDAFYLDGFAPSKNPEMWSQNVLKGLSQHAVDGATVATWSCARVVKDGLRNAGFLLQKKQGFANKRERLEGVYCAPKQRRKQPFSLRSWSTRSAVIIGSGIAGSSIAHELAKKEWTVNVVSATNPHKGHQNVAVIPVFNRQETIATRLSRAGFFAAQNAWKAYFGNGVKRVPAVHFSRQSTDALLAWIEQANIPSSWAKHLSRDDILEQLGYRPSEDGVFFSDSLLVQPELLSQQLLALSKVCVHQDSVLWVKSGQTKRWALKAQSGRVWEADLVVLAGGVGVTKLLQDSGDWLSRYPRLAGLTAHMGAVTYIPAAEFNPRCMVNGRLYALPAQNGYAVLGSRKARGELENIDLDVQNESIELLQKLLPSVKILDPTAYQSWSGVRATTVDHLPILGELQEGLWVATGYGARGYTWATLLAQTLSAELHNEPRRIEYDLRSAMALR